MSLMGHKIFRDGRCAICGKHSAYFCDATGKYYCNEHSKQGNPFTVPTFPGEKAKGKHKYRWGEDVKSRKPRFQLLHGH